MPKVKARGCKSSVFYGKALRTSGGLKKDDLMKNRYGRIVSKKKHKLAKDKSNLKNFLIAKKGKPKPKKKPTPKKKKPAVEPDFPVGPSSMEPTPRKRPRKTPRKTPKSSKPTPKSVGRPIPEGPEIVNW